MPLNVIRNIQFRRATALSWSKEDPILLAGEPGFNLDNGKIKVGNGVDVWSRLPYQESGFQVEQYQITQSLIDSRMLSTMYVPSEPTQVRVEVQGAGPQYYSVDYTVSGRVVQWAGLGMEIVLILNRIIRVSYTA